MPRSEPASSAKTSAVVACSRRSTWRTFSGSGWIRSKREACDDQTVVFGLMSSFSARDLVAMTVPFRSVFPRMPWLNGLCAGIRPPAPSGFSSY
jgi:hypothetical protein